MVLLGKNLRLHVKTILTIFAISLFLATIIPSNAYGGYFIQKVNGKVIFVPDDFSTIQEAIKAANDGDVIIVRDGVYVENVDVFKDVSIISENGPHSTIVVANASSDSVFDILSDNVTLTGFTIKGASSDAGVSIPLLVSGCNISNNIIVENLYGIRLTTALNNIIENNLITNNTFGIKLEASARGNIISRNTIMINSYGIYLDRSFGNEIYLNYFENDVNAFSIDSTNIWNTPEQINYIYQGRNYTSYLGNFWSDYRGEDVDNDGIGDSPYGFDSDSDYYPLMGRFENNTIIPVDVFPPVIEYIDIEPEDPEPYEDIYVIACIDDRGTGVNKTLLWYRINYGTWIQIEMTKEDGIWVAVIPGKPAGTTIELYIEVFDNEGNSVKSDIIYISVYLSSISGFPAAGVIIPFLFMFLAVLMFFVWKGRRGPEESEGTLTRREAIEVAPRVKEDRPPTLRKPPLTLRKKPVVEVSKLSEEEKRILFELESEKNALEDLLRNLDEKYRSRKIEAKEYYELYKEYKRELYLVEKRLREFKVKLGLRGTLRCMVCGLEIRSGEDIVFCRYCNSPAHREHLLEWLHIKGICPYCRHPLRETDLL